MIRCHDCLYGRIVRVHSVRGTRTDRNLIYHHNEKGQLDRLLDRDAGPIGITVVDPLHT